MEYLCEKTKEIKIFTLDDHVALDEKLHDLTCHVEIFHRIIMFDENHMGWKLVRGVRLDVINLIKSFHNKNSIRFEDFCKVWKNMNFSLIFRHRYTFTELLEFSEEILQIAKEYLSSVFEFHTRVTTVYILYGLYFKQPIKGAAKIRFTKSEWEEMCLLMEKCKAAGHYDVVFIHLKLFLSGAYTFTATLRPAGLEQGFRKYSEQKVFSKNCDVQLFYKPLISEKLVKSLIHLESLYCEKKSELLGKKNLMFIDGKFAEALREELNNYESSLQMQYTGKQKDCIENNESVQSSSETSPKKQRSRGKSARETRPSGEENDVEPFTKKSKPGKMYQELLAKKKAEYYIQMLQKKSNQELDSEKVLSLDLPSDSDSSDDT